MVTLSLYEQALCISVPCFELIMISCSNFTYQGDSHDYVVAYVNYDNFWEERMAQTAIRTTFPVQLWALTLLKLFWVHFNQ